MAQQRRRNAPSISHRTLLPLNKPSQAGVVIAPNASEEGILSVSPAPNPRWNAVKDVTRMMSAIVANKDLFLHRHRNCQRRENDSGDTPSVQCWTSVAVNFNDPNFIASVHADPDGRDLGMSADRTGHQTTSGEIEKYDFCLTALSFSLKIPTVFGSFL